MTKTYSNNNPIRKNNFPLCSLQQTHQVKLHLGKKKQDLKQDIKMFAQLYIASQVRDMQELFNHETRKKPPSVAKAGEIRDGVKANLLSCIKGEVFSAQKRIRG